MKLTYIALFVYLSLCIYPSSSHASNSSEEDRQYLLEITNLADTGDGEAQYKLAMVYETGARGVSRDEKLAQQWYLRSANTGYAKGAFVIGNICELKAFHIDTNRMNSFLSELRRARIDSISCGEWVDSQTPGKDLQWWRIAAEKGYAPAQYMIGKVGYIKRQKQGQILRDNLEHLGSVDNHFIQSMQAAR